MNKLQSYLKEKAPLSPSYYTDQPFLNRAISRLRFTAHGLFYRVEKKDYAKEQPPKTMDNKSVFITDNGIFDEDSYKLGELLRKLELGIRYPVYDITDLINTFEMTQSILSRLGYDENLHQVRDIAKGIAEIATNHVMQISPDKHGDEDFELAHKANELDRKYKLGINPYKRIVESLREGIHFCVEYYFYEKAVQRVDLAIEVSKRLNIGLDVQNLLPYEDVIKSLRQSAEFWIGCGDYESAAKSLEALARLTKIIKEFKLGNDQELRDKYSGLLAVLEEKKQKRAAGSLDSILVNN